jgi:hypothetical protein
MSIIETARPTEIVVTEPEAHAFPPATYTKRHRSGRVVVEGGLGFGWGPAGVQANVGVDFLPKDPMTGRRKHDVFVAAPGVKIVAPMVTPVLGFRQRGIEKSVSIAGVGGSKGHPYRDEQVKISPPFVGLAAGKELSGFKLEAPLALLAPLASLVGANDVASYINSLGLYGYFIKPQVVVNFQNERVQKAVLKASNRVNTRMDAIKNGLPHLPKRKKLATEPEYV